MADEREPPRSTVDRLTLGKLLEHGPAQYEFRQNGEPTYFVRVQTESGEVTRWGKGLQRAFEKSETRPRIGEQIGVRENGTDPVSVSWPQKDSEGRVIASRTVHTPRRHWIVERREVFDERMAAAQALRDPRVHPRQGARDHAVLIGAYFVLASARVLAEEQIKTPSNRDRFVSLVRESLARTVEMGEPLPEVRARDRELLATSQPQMGLPEERVKTR